MQLHQDILKEIQIRALPTSYNVRNPHQLGCTRAEVGPESWWQTAAHALPRLTPLLVLAFIALVPVRGVQAQVEEEELPQRFATLRLHNLHLHRLSDCELTLRSAPDQGADYRHPVQVPPRQVVDVDLVSLTATQGGEFSGIVDCTRPVTSILFYGDRNSRMYGGYTGLAPPEISKHWHILQAYTGHSELLSRVVVQNSSASVNQVRFEFLETHQGNVIHEVNIEDLQPYAAHSLELSQIPSLQLVPEVQVRLSSLYPIVPLVFNINANTSASWHPEAAYTSSLGVYVPSGRPLTEFHWPSRLVEYHGLNTELKVLNPGPDPAHVSVQYPPFGEEGTVVLPGVVTSLLVPDFVPKGFVAPLVLKSDVPIHVVTQTKFEVQRLAVQAGTSARGRKLSAPLVLKKAEGFSSLVSCQNTGMESTEVIFEYVSQFARVKVIRPGRNTLVSVHREELLPDGFSGSMIVRAYEPLKCVVLNMRQELLEEAPDRAVPEDQQTVMMYEALVID